MSGLTENVMPGSREEKALRLLESVESGKVQIFVPKQVQELIEQKNALQIENAQFRQDLLDLIEIVPVIVSELKEIGFDNIKKALPEGLISKLTRKIAKQSIGGFFSSGKPSQPILTPEEINQVLSSVVTYVMHEKPRLAQISTGIISLITTYAEKLGIEVSFLKHIPDGNSETH